MSQTFVIDANVLFSAFISGKDLYHLLFSEYNIYLPDFALTELEKYKARIVQKARLKERDFQEFVLKLLHDVTVIPLFLLSKSSLKKAYRLCKELDEKDTIYVAVSLEFNIPLITNDRTLYSGLRNRHFRRVVLLSDVLNTLPRLEG